MKKINDTKYFNGLRNKIKVKSGGWLMGDGVITHGHDLLNDFLGQVSFFQLMILHATGRLPERNFAEWVEVTFMCVSWPDPRIWCNQIAALAANARTTPAAAICLGSLAADSKIYGVGTLEAATQYIKEAMNFIESGGTVKEFIETKSKRKNRLIVPGFARPIAKGDERIIAIQPVEKKLGLKHGKYLKLAFEINDYLYEHYEESINFSGYIAAFLVDYGFSSEEMINLYAASVQGGLYACYKEYISKTPSSLLPLQCNDVDYQGIHKRKVPPKKPKITVYFK